MLSNGCGATSLLKRQVKRIGIYQLLSLVIDQSELFTSYRFTQLHKENDNCFSNQFFQSNIYAFKQMHSLLVAVQVLREQSFISVCSSIPRLSKALFHDSTVLSTLHCALNISTIIYTVRPSVFSGSTKSSTSRSLSAAHRRSSSQTVLVWPFHLIRLFSRMFCCVGDDKKRGAVLDFEDAGAVRTEKVATLDAAVNSQMRQEQQARARMFQQISDKDKQIANLNKSLKALNSQQVAPEKDSQIAELEAQIKQLRDLHQSQAKREQVNKQPKKSAAEAQRIAELEKTVKATAAAKAAVEADAAAKEQKIAFLTAETEAASAVKAQAAIEKAVLEKERQTAEQAVLARETQIAALELKLSKASETVAKKEAVQKQAVKKAANDALAKLEADLAIQARQKAAAEQEVTAKEAQIALLELQVLKKQDLESELIVKVREKFHADNEAAANRKLLEEQMEARVAAQQEAETKEARILALQEQVAEMSLLEAELVKLASNRSSDENNRIAELEAEVQAKAQAKVVLEASHLQKDERIALLDSSIHKLEAELEAGKQVQLC